MVFHDETIKSQGLNAALDLHRDCFCCFHSRWRRLFQDRRWRNQIALAIILIPLILRLLHINEYKDESVNRYRHSYSWWSSG